MMRSKVNCIRKQLAPFHFKYLAIEPRSKTFYPNVDPWECVRLGGNIAAEYDSHHHIILDCDTREISPILAPVFAHTAVFDTPKGYGIILRGTVPWSYYAQLRAYSLTQKGFMPPRVNDEDLEHAIPIIELLKKIGIKDDTAFHGLFPSADGRTYSLLPPSVTCAYHGIKGRVRNHSSQLPICNHSPNGVPHKWVARTWYNFTYDLMSVAEFFETIGVAN